MESKQKQTFFWANILILFRTTSIPLHRETNQRHTSHVVGDKGTMGACEAAFGLITQQSRAVNRHRHLQMYSCMRALAQSRHQDHPPIVGSVEFQDRVFEERGPEESPGEAGD